MDRKDDNTFPFYNLPPEPEKYLEKEFFCAFVLSLLDKIKDGGDSCLPRHFVKTNANANQHSKTVSSIPTDHRIGDSAGEYYL